MSVEDLRTFLQEVAPGPVGQTRELARLLWSCWHAIEISFIDKPGPGSPNRVSWLPLGPFLLLTACAASPAEGAVREQHPKPLLHLRAAVWLPPVLSFVMERLRHEAPPGGATTAEDWVWTLDVNSLSGYSAPVHDSSLAGPDPMPDNVLSDGFGERSHSAVTSPPACDGKDGERVDPRTIAQTLVSAIAEGRASPCLQWRSQNDVRVLTASAFPEGSDYKRVLTKRRRRLEDEVGDALQLLGWRRMAVGRFRRLAVGGHQMPVPPCNIEEECALPRPNVKRIADTIAETVKRGERARYLEWRSPDDVRVLTPEIFGDASGPQTTVAYRRTRLREGLILSLRSAGWEHTTANLFRRIGCEATMPTASGGIRQPAEAGHEVRSRPAVAEQRSHMHGHNDRAAATTADHDEMLRILRALVTCRDPATGDPITEPDLLAAPPVKRALDRAILELQCRSTIPAPALAPPTEGTAGPAAPRSGDDDTELLAKLRSWRRAVAAEAGVAAYMVADDRTLKEIATVAPLSLEQLGRVRGIGPARLEKYGSEMLLIVRRHRSAHTTADGLPRVSVLGAAKGEEKTPPATSPCSCTDPRWSDGDDERLRRLSTAGYDEFLLAQHFGRTQAAVQRRLRELQAQDLLGPAASEVPGSDAVSNGQRPLSPS
jgi:hypothetical protein